MISMLAGFKKILIFDFQLVYMYEYKLPSIVRLRRSGIKVTIYFGYLKKYLLYFRWWIIERGYPNREDDGVVRLYHRVRGREDAERVHGELGGVYGEEPEYKWVWV